MPLGLVSRLKTLESLETLGGLEASRLLGRDFRDFQDQKYGVLLLISQVVLTIVLFCKSQIFAFRSSSMKLLL